MQYKKLDSQTIDLYLDFLRKAIELEPDEMMLEEIDEEGIKRRINDQFFQKTSSILAIERDKVVGRIEYHFYGCIQDGYKMAYVDWVYVLPEYRHKGIAQGLFKEFEKECISFGIDQYYLIRSEDEKADRFYNAFENAELSKEPLLRKYIGNKDEALTK